jgi:hypothetical protein
MTDKWQNLDDEKLANVADQGLRGQGAVVESMRRLKVALHREERAIKWLTVILVVLTVVLVVLTVFLVLPELTALRR